MWGGVGECKGFTSHHFLGENLEKAEILAWKQKMFSKIIDLRVLILVSVESLPSLCTRLSPYLLAHFKSLHPHLLVHFKSSPSLVSPR
jgi:hypothetical protein